MNDDLLRDLMRTMANHGFRQVPGTTAISDAMLLLKRQTWNTNRAIVIVCPAQIPTDIRDYLRRRVAFRFLMIVGFHVKFGNITNYC
jgi:hypothetical protein